MYYDTLISLTAMMIDVKSVCNALVVSKEKIIFKSSANQKFLCLLTILDIRSK